MAGDTNTSAPSDGGRIVIARNELAHVLGAWTTFAERMARDLLARSADKAEASAALRRLGRAHRLAIGAVSGSPLFLEHVEQIAEVLEKVTREGAGAEPYRPTRRPQSRQPRER